MSRDQSGTLLEMSSELPSAQAHGLSSLVYWKIRATCAEAVPPPILSQLRESFCMNSRRNLLLTHELFRLVRLLAQDGIDVMVFKGPILSLLVYQNPCLRPFADLDILVRPHDVPRVADHLRRVGYTWDATFSAAQERLLMTYGSERVFMAPSSGIEVDVHWRLLPFEIPCGDTQEVWRRSERVTLAGQHVTTMGAEDLLLYLSAHGSKHSWDRLGWIGDVAALIAIHRFDWPALVARSEAQGTTRMLFLALRLARDLLGTTLPEDLSRRVDVDGVVAGTVCRLCEKLVSDARWDVDVLDQLRHDIAMMIRVRDRARYLAWMMAARERDALLPWDRTPLLLAWALRPWRLFLKYGCRLLVKPREPFHLASARREPARTDEVGPA